MSTFILPTLALIFYFLAMLSQMTCKVVHTSYRKTFLICFAYPALVFHAWLLYLWIDVGMGQNLTVLNIISQVAWAVALFNTIALYFWRLEKMILVTYPISSLSIFLVLLIPMKQVVYSIQDPAIYIHILLFLISLSIFFMAAIQSFMIIFQNYLLKHSSKLFIIKTLPSLEQTEKLFFLILSWAFLVLTVMMFMSVIYFYGYMKNHLQHITLAMAAWFIYFILLIGRYFFGWRGVKAAVLSFSGFSILVLCYLVTYYNF